jgi:excinuclease UvrABC ATPase subunit
LPKLPRPQVDRIEGLAPAIALSQNRFTSGMRSTVATLPICIRTYVCFLLRRGCSIPLLAACP